MLITFQFVESTKRKKDVDMIVKKKKKKKKNVEMVIFEVRALQCCMLLKESIIYVYAWYNYSVCLFIIFQYY